MGQQPATNLKAGRDYPTAYAELLAWFPDDAACLDYLEWLRWPNGFVCPHCGVIGGGCKLGDGRWWCYGCRRRVSVTAGTVFHGTRTPLTIWFAAAWHMVASKSGVSAKTLHELLGFGSYQTAWAMLHRYRRAMVRPGRSRLGGPGVCVEVDETFYGGPGGKVGRGTAKAQIVIAVEQKQPRGFGRARMEVIPMASSVVLGRFLAANVAAGSIIVTDGWGAYPAAIPPGCTHQGNVQRGSGVSPTVALPGVHRVASLVKRWLLGTHQGAVEEDHLQEYLEEWCFRFNRKSSRARGLLFRRLLEQCLETSPIGYRQLVVSAQTKSGPGAPAGKRTRPPSLAVAIPPRPWRKQP